MAVGVLRARLAIGAVIVSAALSAAFALVVATLPPSGAFPIVLSLADAAIHLGAIVLFLVWIHRAATNARLLGATLRYSPWQSVTAYLIPFLNLVRPYQVMIAIHRASDPTRLPDAPRFVKRDLVGYREADRELLPPVRWSYAAPIAAWWAVYMLRGIAVGWIGMVAGPTATAVLGPLAALASGVLAVLVIHSVDARQRELARRLGAQEAGSR